MSRIAKKPIILPAGVSASFTDGVFSVTGSLGKLERRFRDDVKIDIGANNEISVTAVSRSVFSRALSGTYASHINNMIEGVSKGFEKKLIIEGVGYRYAIVGDNVKLDIGFSHPVEIPIPTDLKVVTEKNQMTISGIDKEQVGSFSAKIRALKKAEPYKGKGIRYVGEIIRRKQGKKAGASA